MRALKLCRLTSTVRSVARKMQARRNRLRPLAQKLDPSAGGLSPELMGHPLPWAAQPILLRPTPATQPATERLRQVRCPAADDVTKRTLRQRLPQAAKAGE